eukprot:TRINITY_DN43781_c0_g1_i1.p2 TRINITY_DN43781_c0_g1~~TRINITY_DN43781_c0_g1_i1.p2  ORF type:complete len:151 (-),score=36.79 TRINITY_DN43781_c0_g1_i1:8-460(-)
MDKPVFDAGENTTAAEGTAGADGDGDSSRPSKLPYWASNLEESVDKKLLIMLRDGRTLVGWLRTFDQFANLLLEHVVDRHIVYKEQVYADVYLGSMLIRGENVALFGEIDEERDAQGELKEAPLDYVLQLEAIDAETNGPGEGQKRMWDD